MALQVMGEVFVVPVRLGLCPLLPEGVNGRILIHLIMFSSF